MVELKENFVIFMTLFVLFFFLPKFLPHFGVKLLFMLFMRLIAFQALSSIIRLHMSIFLGHPLTIITFSPLDLLVSFFFSLMSTTKLSLDLDFIVFLVMAKLKKGIGVMILSLIFFVFLVMLSSGNTDYLLNSHFHSSLTTSPVLELFPDESLVPSTNTFDPPLDFSLDIFDASPRQVEDEQVDDELPTLSLGPLLLLRLKILHKTYHLATQPG